MKAVLKKMTVGAMGAAVLLFAGCNSSTPPAATEAPAAAKPAAPEPVTAKTAFGAMYTTARSWAPDVAILTLVSKDVPGFTIDAGKAPMWEATFVSATQRQYRVDDYAIVSKPPEIHKGVSAGLPLPWGGATRDAMPVDPSNFTVDSDAAYTAAAADAAEWLTKNPGKKLTSMALGNMFKFHALVWYVVWGDEKSGGYAAYVDASTGKVLKK